MTTENEIRPDWLIELEYASFFSPLVDFEDYEGAEEDWETGVLGAGSPALVQNPAGWIRKKKRQQIYTRDTFVCQYCAADLRDEPVAHRHLDHLVARLTWKQLELTGSPNVPGNLVTSCRTCNDIKVENPLVLFLDSLAGLGYDPRNVRKRIKNALRRKLPVAPESPLDLDVLPSLEPTIPFLSAEARRQELDLWLSQSATLVEAPWRKNPSGGWGEWLDELYPTEMFR